LVGLKVLLMGSPRIEVDGEPIKVDTRKAVALLAYLAVEGETVRRDSLAAMLWPEYETEGARGALRRTLSTLKGALGGRWLRIDRSTVAFTPDESTSVDVTDFNALVAAVHRHEHGARHECATCERDLSAAAALYRSDFMKGFSLRDSIDFEDWQVFQAESLRRALGSVLERLVGFLQARGDLDDAIDSARRWLSLDILHEPAHRRLMLLLALAGDRAGAMRAYREFVAILEKELGVPPLTETTELYQAIQEGQVAAPEHIVPPRSPVIEAVGAARLIGRDKEMSALLAALDEAAERGRLVAIEGEAGIGKTKLAEAFLERAAAAGSTVVAARCYEEEISLAYSPIMDALQSALNRTNDWVSNVPEHVLAEGARLLPVLAHEMRPEADFSGPGAQHRFLEALSTLLLAACGGSRPGILFFDDVQWADEAAVDVLAHLVRRFETQRVLLLLSWRTEDVRADDRIRRLLVHARARKAATEIELSRLGRADVTEMVRSQTSDRLPSDELEERLFTESEGVPLFVTEYVATLADRSPEEETWPLPGGVRDLFKQRLATVGETGSQVLTAAAALGRSFDFETVRDVSGRTDDEVVGALDELIGRQLIHEVGVKGDSLESAYDFSHEKLRTLVYEDTGMARRRLLHRRAAGALQRGRAGDPARAATVARHLHLGGMDEEAAEFYRRAGDYARLLHAHFEALAHYNAALALGHPDSASLHESSGDVFTLLGNYGDSLANYEAAAALSGDVSPSIEHKIGAVHLRRGAYGLAERHFEDSMAALGTGAAASRVLADWSMAAHGAGDAERSRELADRALKVAQESADESALCRAHNVVGLLATRRGQLDIGTAHLGESLRLAIVLDDPGARVAALNNFALTHRAAGEFEVAIELTLEGLKLCASLGDRHREAALHNNLADLLRASGRSDEAMMHLKQAVAIFAEVGDPGEMEPEIWKLVEW
jgi:DNA-binding SARP family transcriptional activator